MQIPEDRADGYKRVREAVANSYDAAALVAAGHLAPEEAELAARQDIHNVWTGVDMGTYSIWHDGGATALVGDNDVALEQLAGQCGGYTETHLLLKRPLTHDDIQMAAGGYAREGVSDEAAIHARELAHAKFCRLREEFLGKQSAPADGPEVDSPEWTAEFIRRRNFEDRDREQQRLNRLHGYPEVWKK
jgi:hypothetical protein